MAAVVEAAYARGMDVHIAACLGLAVDGAASFAVDSIDVIRRLR